MRYDVGSIMSWRIRCRNHGTNTCGKMLSCETLEISQERSGKAAPFLYPYPMRPKRNRPDHDGPHRLQYERNKKIILATQNCCAICGRPVNFELKYPDPMCATVDHIIPIAKGGHPSDLDNLQLAHFKCNKKKGQALEPVKKTPPSNRDLVLSVDWRTF